MNHRRRPKYLFSGLTKCACCGGGYSAISKDLIGCSTARNKGIRSLIDRIVLTPGEDRIEIDVQGDLAGILTLSAQRKNPAAGAAGAQVNLVAGAGFTNYFALSRAIISPKHCYS